MRKCLWNCVRTKNVEFVLLCQLWIGSIVTLSCSICQRMIISQILFWTNISRAIKLGHLKCSCVRYKKSIVVGDVITVVAFICASHCWTSCNFHVQPVFCCVTRNSTLKNRQHKNMSYETGGHCSHGSLETGWFSLSWSFSWLKFMLKAVCGQSKCNISQCKHYFIQFGVWWAMDLHSLP